MNPKVDAYLSRAKKWQIELEKLRRILLDTPLSEELKWGKPCYTFQGKAVVILHGLKESCAFAFFRGALLQDTQDILSPPGRNSQSVRWIKFTSLQEIVDTEPILKAYIREAIDVERAGLKVNFNGSADLEIPAELHDKFDEIPALKTAFDALTPGRKRGYVLYFSAPKQSKTRASRVEKYIPQILDGKGFYDR